MGIWICLGYFCLGGHFTLTPNEMKKVFGEPATQLYSYLYMCFGITGVLEVVLQIFVMTIDNLQIFYYLYGGFSLVSLLILLTMYTSEPCKILV